MKRFFTAALLGTLTVVATAWVLAEGDYLPLLLVLIAVGAPLTVMVLVRAIADPEHVGRRPWLSLILGATVVPAIVLVLHGAFLALGYTLVSPFVEPAQQLWEQLRADPDLFAVLTSGWALATIIELAVVAPLAEETTKPLAALVRRPRTAAEAFLFGAAAGTGFAMIENVMYASGWMWGSLDNWLPVAVLRMLGAGLHAFGAGMVAWGFFQLRIREPGRWRRFWLAGFVALSAHGLWNGSVAVTIALFAARETGGLRTRGDAYEWGVVLMVFLAVLGVVITGALLMAARRIGRGESPLRVLPVEDIGTPQGIAAWALVSSTLLIPMVILVLVYPNIVAL
jgi:RsiW-degrading membrane proteinase PrsW (M82 family)